MCYCRQKSMLVGFDPESSSSLYCRMFCAPDQVRLIWCLDKGPDLFNDPSAVCRKPLSPGKIQECLLGLRAKARPKAAVTHLFVIPEPAAYLGPPTTAPPSLCSTNSKPGAPPPTTTTKHLKPHHETHPITDKFSFALPFSCYVTLDI